MHCSNCGEVLTVGGEVLGASNSRYCSQACCDAGESELRGESAFSLRREPERRRAARPVQVADVPMRQGVLIDGLSCLPGQMDLF